jgi:hypothetical protein
MLVSMRHTMHTVLCALHTQGDVQSTCGHAFEHLYDHARIIRYQTNAVVAYVNTQDWLNLLPKRDPTVTHTWPQRDPYVAPYSATPHVE